jgi:hypothetical protein
MQNFALSMAFVALTFLCWGLYGPVLHEGQHELDGSAMRAFICVGVAYFLIAVVVPVALLRTRGERGAWTAGGTAWSFVAGMVGAIGALGIIFAFKARGAPVYVMPLVFGLAPVVNTLVTMAMSRTFHRAGVVFMAGVVLVAVGAAGVLFFRPALKPPNVTVNEVTDGSIVITRVDVDGSHRSENRWTATNLEDLRTNPELRDAYRLYLKELPLSPLEFFAVVGSILLTAVCWGSYGPTLHEGQMRMEGSRLRPLLCVGLAYFAVAVVVPIAIMAGWNEPGQWTFSGVFWSLAAGAAGAIGALGVIMAFNFGGKPIYVMPLIFGGAPIVNTGASLASTWSKFGTIGDIQPATFLCFLASLLVVVAGAATVLVFAPRGEHKPGGAGLGAPPTAGGKEKAGVH